MIATQVTAATPLTLLQKAGFGQLPEGWSVVTVGDLLSEDRGISVGVMYPGNHTPGGVPLLKVGDLAGSRINPNTEFCISAETHSQYRRTELCGGELLLTLVGAIGQCAIVPPTMSGWNAARAIAVIRLKDQEDVEYVRLCLLSQPLQHLMQVWATTTVQATLNLKEIKQLPLPWPSKNERQRVVQIAGCLEAKIELNRRTNETLEAMARTLFRSWFVDFDPVRAKADGQTPPGLDAATAKLFPDSFEPSALGPIPKGWRVGSIYDVAEVVYGAPFASSQFNGDGLGKPLLRIRDLRSEQPDVFTTEVHPKGYCVKSGDIVVGMDGEFRAYLWGGEEAWLNQRVCVFKPRSGVSNVFVQNALHAPLAEVEATETATTVIHLGKADIDRFRVIIPPETVQKAFTCLAEPLAEAMVGNKRQSRILAATRDALLPKLLSGEVQVGDAERVAEGVA